MTDLVLILAGLVEFILRIVVLIVIFASIIGWLLLIDMDTRDLLGFFRPECWDLFRRRND